MVLLVMLPAKPAHVEGVRIIVVVSFTFRLAADLAGEPLKLAFADGAGHGAVRSCGP